MTKLCSSFPTISFTTLEIINNIDVHTAKCIYPVRIKIDRGSYFISESFKIYCNTNKIQYVLVTTDILKGNSLIEKLNSLIIDVLFKLNTDSTLKLAKILVQICFSS